MDFAWLNAIVVGASCLAMGYCMGARLPLRFSKPSSSPSPSLPSGSPKKSRHNSKEPLEIGQLAHILSDFKMVLVVRNDLKMGKSSLLPNAVMRPWDSTKSSSVVHPRLWTDGRCVLSLRWS
ncbi:hypothetical protein MLD38_008904 [Melastoma candidum]|uniref:Uncharacterized protein n=1 Tax=Melastoma candidum TaxID=119954 RepID=A0ACB9RXS4_9MYRT|nr:hypothetical protein MLD38_008904 [Melastoma candidum]